jgi:hypothetical protein
VTIGSSSFKTVAGQFIELPISTSERRESPTRAIWLPLFIRHRWGRTVGAIGAALQRGPMRIALQLAIGSHPSHDRLALIDIHNGKAGI